MCLFHLEARPRLSGTNLLLTHIRTAISNAAWGDSGKVSLVRFAERHISWTHGSPYRSASPSVHKDVGSDGRLTQAICAKRAPRSQA